MIPYIMFKNAVFNDGIIDIVVMSKSERNAVNSKSDNDSTLYIKRQQ